MHRDGHSVLHWVQEPDLTVGVSETTSERLYIPRVPNNASENAYYVLARVPRLLPGRVSLVS